MVKFCKSKKCLNGKTAIITGANTGIGYETALEFAKRGARVIMACRNLEKAETSKDRIVKATGNEEVIVKQLILDSMDSVRGFAKDIIETEARLDLLVNNGGSLGQPDVITPDGLQLQMAINYFSHFLLTNLLLDLLKQSAPSRVINVSSALAGLIRNLKLDELNKLKVNSFLLYSKTKLCNIYFTQELANRLKGTGITTYSLHPGAVNTEIARDSKIGTFIGKTFYISSEEGAQTTLYVSLEEGIEKYNGENFENCKRIKPYRGAKDSKKRTQLWEISAQMVGLSKLSTPNDHV